MVTMADCRRFLTALGSGIRPPARALKPTTENWYCSKTFKRNHDRSSLQVRIRTEIDSVKKKLEETDKKVVALEAAIARSDLACKG